MPPCFRHQLKFSDDIFLICSKHSLSPKISNTLDQQNYVKVVVCWGGTRWRSWLRHYDTSRKIAGSIPDGAIWIFHWHNPSGRTMALGLTQPLTEMGKKVKQSHYRSWQSLRFPGGRGSQISRQSAHEGSKVVSLKHRPPLPPENIPGTHFCWWAG
jgi:hypothetical protein